MKLLFIHDHPFYREGETVYSGGGLPFTAWVNYLINFKELIVYGRNSRNVKNRKVQSSAPNVSFYLTELYTSALDLLKNKGKINRELETLIQQVDIVLVRLPSVLGIIAGSIASKHNKYIWVEQVGNAKEALSSYGSLLGKVVAPFFELENRKLVKKADFISYVTENKLQKDYPAAKNAIVVSLSDVIINNIIDERELDEERFAGDKFRIGLIGGFDARYKGQDTLLKAVSILDQDIKKDIKLSFVGKGDYAWVTGLAKDLDLQNNIEYIGPLESGDAINQFLKTMSLYVQPSLTEGMPRATIEAMAMGCPVIGSNVGGIPDIVAKEWLHEKGNARELSEHIQKLYSDREALKKEAILSLKKVIPYLKHKLDQKRLSFYTKINKSISL